jgi:hypothetical protein
MSPWPAGGPSAGSATMLMILHEGHTGTHALCEAFGKLGCVMAECIEIGFNVGDIANFMQRAHSAGKRYAVRMYSMWDAKKSIGELRTWAAADRLWFLTHVRLDIMRYALSLYSGGNPQFSKNHEADTTQKVYDPEKLSHFATRATQVWSTQLSGMKELPHDHTRALFYEDLLASQDTDDTGIDRVERYLLWVLDMVGNVDTCTRTAEATCLFPELHRCAFYGVQKVHSSNISTFVSNADEVLKRWAERPRTDFLEMARTQSIPSSMILRWPAQWLPAWSDPVGPPPHPPPPPTSPPPSPLPVPPPPSPIFPPSPHVPPPSSSLTLSTSITGTLSSSLSPPSEPARLQVDQLQSGPMIFFAAVAVSVAILLVSAVVVLCRRCCCAHRKGAKRNRKAKVSPGKIKRQARRTAPHHAQHAQDGRRHTKYESI